MFVVKFGVFMGGYKYRFCLESWVVIEGNVKGFFVWEEEVNKFFEFGVCEVIFMLGCVFCFNFIIGCIGWIDDIKLKYSVGV